MVTKYFYLRRKDEIDKRLAEIELGWSRDEVINWLNNNYDLHSHKLGFCEVGAIITEKKLLEILVDCIGRKVLAGIFKRFVTNIKDYRKGMPDLLVWNEETKKSKFVEVKGENDKLSIAQSLWIKHLKTIGADVEVCLVHSIGSKRKKKF
ncbi:hypothetical protein NQ318_011788 [Aromia moschata]|uniref:Fanconi-associated nuclease n=1 Tax=Aromia moschata TaxID=1265417 RepID=A0AAV8Y6F0_9CUCU|nr:hypothetical protein NQ318_011788 [Aromia moschata]